MSGTHGQKSHILQLHCKGRLMISYIMSVVLLILVSTAHGSPVLVSHIAEITPASPPVLETGILAFLKGLKPTGSSNPGTFAHIKSGATASAGDVNLQLFDPIELDSFVRTPAVSFPVVANEAIKFMAYDASTGYLYAEFDQGSAKGGIRASTLTYDSETGTFKSGPRVELQAPSPSSIQHLIAADDGTVRYYTSSGTSTRTLHKLIGNTVTVWKVLPYSNKRLLPQMLKIG